MGYFDDIIESKKIQEKQKIEEESRKNQETESGYAITRKYVHMALNDFVSAAKEIGLSYYDKGRIARYYTFPPFFRAWSLHSLVWVDVNNVFYGIKSTVSKIVRITKEEAVNRIAKDIYRSWIADKELSDNVQYRSLEYTEEIAQKEVKKIMSWCLDNKYQTGN